MSLSLPESDGISFESQICHLILRKEVAPHLIALVSSSWHVSQTPFRDGITWFSSTCSSRQHLCNCSQGRSKGAENISSLLPHSRELELLWKQEQLSRRRIYWIGFYNLLDILQMHGEKKLKTTEVLPHLLQHLSVDSLVRNGFAHNKLTLTVCSWSCFVEQPCCVKHSPAVGPPYQLSYKPYKFCLTFIK